MRRTALYAFWILITQVAMAAGFEEEVRRALKNPLGQAEKLMNIGPEMFNHQVHADNRPKAGEFWFAVVGDSSTTGAASSPKFQATWLNLAGHLADVLQDKIGNLGPEDNLPAPLRVLYTKAEFDQANREGKVLELKVESDLSKKVDTEEYSFGYQLSEKLRVDANHVVLVGQDGSRISSMNDQFQRIMSVGVGTLPPLVLVSYVANDLCHPDNFKNPLDQFRASYSAEVIKQFNSLSSFPAAPGGTNVMVIAPLDISNLLTDPDLLNQKITFEGNSQLTCQQMRQTLPHGGDAAKEMQLRLINECRGILGPAENSEERLVRLRQLQDIQAQVLIDAVAAFNARNLPIKANYAASAKDIRFQAGDLANDCFHPSRNGAGRLADQLLTHELSDVLHH